MRRLLVLRPEPGASATLARARRSGLDAFAVPLFEIEPRAWDVPDLLDFDAILFTSANAVKGGGEQLDKLLELPAYAVGEATANAAREAGFAIAGTGGRDVEQLLSSIDPGLRLLHLGGEQRREPANPPQRIAFIPVYAAKPVDAPDLSAAGSCVALIHSPRAGRRFASLVVDRRSICIAAISAAASEAVGTGWEAVEVAEVPTDDALLALAARLCNKPALL